MKQKEAEEIKELKPYMTIWLKDGTEQSWYSHEEVVAWLSNIASEWGFSEMPPEDGAEWSALEILAANHPPPYRRNSIAASEIYNLITQSLKTLESIESRKQDDQTLEEQFNEAKSMLEKFAQHTWLLPNSSYKTFIFDLRNKDIDCSRTTLLMDYLFDESIRSQGRLPTLSDSNFRKILPTIFEMESFVRDPKNYLTQYELLLAVAKDQLKEYKIRLLAMKRLEELYNKRMALEAPVTYWTEKAREHRQHTRELTTILKKATPAFFFGVPILVFLILILTTWVIEKLGMTGTINMPFATTGVSIFMIMLAAWIIRLLSRLLLSQIHLQNDATERVTMTKTYQVLVENKSEKEEHLSIVLNALFRPSNDGVVKDDGTPVTASQVLLQMAKSQSARN